jgi:hypothetical protein
MYIGIFSLIVINVGSWFVLLLSLLPVTNQYWCNIWKCGHDPYTSRTQDQFAWIVWKYNGWFILYSSGLRLAWWQSLHITNFIPFSIPLSPQLKVCFFKSPTKTYFWTALNNILMFCVVFFFCKINYMY